MSLEPLYEYMVQVEAIDGTTVSINTLAHTKYHARAITIGKFMHIQPDETKYSMGVKAHTSKRDLQVINNHIY